MVTPRLPLCPTPSWTNHFSLYLVSTFHAEIYLSLPLILFLCKTQQVMSPTFTTGVDNNDRASASATSNTWTYSKLSMPFLCWMQDYSRSLTSSEEKEKNQVPWHRPGSILLAGWYAQHASHQDPHHTFFTDAALSGQPPAHSVAEGTLSASTAFLGKSHSSTVHPQTLSGCSRTSIRCITKIGINSQILGWWELDQPHLAHWLCVSFQHIVTVD